MRLQTITDTLEGELTARHYKTGEPLSLRWVAGQIVEVAPAPTAPEGVRVAPGLVDLQINGYGGVDFQLDATGLQELHHAARALRRDGAPRFLLTLITRHWPELLAQLARLKAIRDGDPFLRRAIAGWHVEGPFISGEVGFVGAHDPLAVCDPTPEAMDQLKAVTGEDPVLLTLAPERAGALEMIRRAREHGFVVSGGHSNPPRERLAAAVAAGLGAYTHLGNGCPQQLDRHDNILWRVLDEPGITAGVIPDTHHVSPSLFRLMHRAHSSLYWTTDAMSGAGAPPGLYTIAHHTIEVGADGVARQPGKTNFAGSALAPDEGIRRGAAMLGRPWYEVWDFFSINPARLMGLPCGLEVGAPALFALVEE